MDFNSILTVIVTNGMGGACAAAVLWFAYYRETVTIPKMVEAFTRALVTAQTDFGLRNDKILEAFTQLTREERKVYLTNHEENRDRLDKLFAETRELRHDIGGLAHQLGLRQAVAEGRRLGPGAGAARPAGEGT